MNTSTFPSPSLDDPALLTARDARREARDVLGPGFDARVLEPSPPATLDGEWPNDPVARGTIPPGSRLVTPVGAGDLQWSDWVWDNHAHTAWASARWLGAYRRLVVPPAGYATTREALHKIAMYVVTPAQRRVNGEIALRYTMGGFGTHFFGDDEQVRVAGHHIVRQRGATARAEAIATLAQAASVALDAPPDVAWAEGFDAPPAGDPDAPLGLDPVAAAFLGDWFGFAYSLLEELRAEPESRDPSPVHLWPEHFDAAFDCLEGDRRIGMGCSPGDRDVPEPYVYVLPHDYSAAPSSDYWNATAFRGSILTLSGFVDGDDQREAVLSFVREGRRLMSQ